jgi:hypothetical protein
MTISGALTKQQQRIDPLIAAATCLLIGVGGGGLSLWEILRLDYPISLALKIAVIGFFPAMAAILYALAYVETRRMVVEFTCDQSAFYFRRLGHAEPETRTLAEIVKIYEQRRRFGGVACYWMTFRDGSEVYLSPAASLNAKPLFEHLHSG